VSKRADLTAGLQGLLQKTASDVEMYDGVKPDDDFFAGLQESGLALMASRVQVTRKGAIFDHIDENEWKSFFDVIQSFKHAMQWIIADWARYGHDVLGWSFEDMHDLTGYQQTTLKQAAYVARNVGASVRTDASFTHHALVASKSEDEQIKLLKQVKEKNLSVEQLRQLIGESPTLTAADPLGVADFKRQTRTIQRVVERVGRVKTIDSEKERDETLERIARVQEWLDAARALIERVSVGGNDG